MLKGFAWSLLFLSLHAFAQVTNPEKIQAIQNVTRIAFGSCNDQKDAQPLWRDMTQMNPDLFIWGGDAIYADWDTSYDIKASYEKQYQHPDYIDFRSRFPILGTWDDHDYGYDNADGNFKLKHEAQRHFLDFLEETHDSPRRVQDGIYTSYEFNSDGKKVKIILLDNRFSKNLEKDYELLGKKQWDWFEAEIKNSQADLHFIVTGLSIFSPLIPYTEEWAQYPSEINRMLRIVRTYNPKGVVFLTGDKHFASIFQRYGQLEFMSSGMTHVAPRKTWWYLGRKYPTTYFGLNYGLIDIAWEGSTPLLTLSIRTPDSRDVFKTKFKWVDKSWVYL